MRYPLPFSALKQPQLPQAAFYGGYYTAEPPFPQAQIRQDAKGQRCFFWRFRRRGSGVYSSCCTIPRICCTFSRLWRTVPRAAARSVFPQTPQKSVQKPTSARCHFFENDVSRAEGAFAAPSGCLQGRLPPCILFIHFLVVTGQRCGNARHHLKRFGNALSQPDQLFICLRRDRFIVPSCMLERCSRLSPVPLTTQEIASSATRVSMPV